MNKTKNKIENPNKRESELISNPELKNPIKNKIKNMEKTIRKRYFKK